MIKDTKLAYVIYFDGELKGIWDEHNEPLVAKVRCKRTKAYYKPKEIERYERHYKRIYKGSGRLEWKKHLIKDYPKLYEKWTYYQPYFTSLGTLIATFRKVDGLELVEDE